MAKPDLVVLNSAYSLYRRDVTTPVGDETMTRQEMADECDINKIMARYEKVGANPLMNNNNRVPMYLDLTATPGDLMVAMEQLRQADDAFMRLPAHVRREFDNDAMRFVEYASDAGNLERLREWGLAEPAPAPDKPMRVEVINPQPDEKKPPKGADTV